MISVLVLGASEAELAELEKADPSVEVLLAHGVDDALEKLGRNRRIDAVLIADGSNAERAERIVEAIREDSPAHPPIFVPGEVGFEIPHTAVLTGRGSREMLSKLKDFLEP